MKKQYLQTFLFFILIAVANAHANSGMEKEILRQLGQIQAMGEEKWKEHIKLEKKRQEFYEFKRSKGRQRLASN